ncbi:DUF5605 domain-containing protein [Lacrimispora sp. 38-1]|uniref:DUF5605 domain-containing protein n=1 Tax=Lacrimispora sp. 38-1 TaxID=3125778 RepID=UPI003CF17614
MKRIQQYDIFEVSIKDIANAGLVEYCGIFTKGNIKKVIPAFKYREKEYMVRFMPDQTGIWSYRITLGGQEFSGEFECIACGGGNHGPVRTEGVHFRYTDGSRYIPFGTTCYAWTNQPEELQVQTLDTLKASCFNKIRMCIFPKSMPYNNNEPEYFPFAGSGNEKWNIKQPVFAFWDNLDKRIKDLCELGIEADIILFHPYDRWGFAKISQQESLEYLEYCIARLAAYRNVWWSLANEYEMVYKKIMEDWNEYGELLKKKDPYGHLISIHQILTMYPKKNWMTHCSVQSMGIHYIPVWKQEYEMPVIVDECGYEGDIEYAWGNISAFEMAHRFWVSVCRGGYCTHGETFHREDEVLWWAKGGILYGQSESRISFLRDLLYSLPEEGEYLHQITDENPNQDKDAVQQDKYFKTLLEKAAPDRTYDVISHRPMVLFADDYRLEYLGRSCPVFARVNLPKDGQYRVEVIDIWAMTRTMIAEGISGQVKIGLPGKEGIAILITRMSGQSLKLN